MIIRAANGGQFRVIFFGESAAPLEPTDQRGTFTTTNIVTYKRALLDQINGTCYQELCPSVLGPRQQTFFITDINFHLQDALSNASRILSGFWRIHHGQQILGPMSALRW